MTQAKMRWFAEVPSDVPEEEHYAILRERKINIPGDERSRTDPGHGYPATTEQVVTYEVFKIREEFIQELTSVMQKPFNGTVRGIHVSGESYRLSMVASLTIKP